MIVFLSALVGLQTFHGLLPSSSITVSSFGIAVDIWKIKSLHLLRQWCACTHHSTSTELTSWDLLFMSRTHSSVWASIPTVSVHDEHTASLLKQCVPFFRGLQSLWVEWFCCWFYHLFGLSTKRSMMSRIRCGMYFGLSLIYSATTYSSSMLFRCSFTALTHACFAFLIHTDFFMCLHTK